MPRWVLIPLIGLLMVFDTIVAMRHGYLSVFPPFPTLPMTQMFADLAIALGLIGLWMIADTRQRGRPLLLGTLGPLLYLAFRTPRQGVVAPTDHPG
jgi:hypothetical protein